MGFQQLARTAGGRVEHIWFQLVYSDRFLSLMIGSPFVIADANPFEEGETQDMTPSQSLERLHVAIAERTISRNLQMRRDEMDCETSDHRYYGYEETRKIDEQVKKAARPLPPSWWLRFPRENTAPDINPLENVGKLLIQLHHYYLIIHLHQPYLIQLLAQDHGSEASGWLAVSHTYSKLAAASAGREALLQYIALRGLRRPPSYRLIDEKMYVSALTLLFAHFDGHRHGNTNVLDHQRFHDLGLIGELTNILEIIATTNEDSRGVVLVRILKTFLVIENNASEGSVYRVWNDQHLQGDYWHAVILNHDSLSFFVPYFGVIYFLRERKQLPPHAEEENARVGSMIVQEDINYQFYEPQKASKSIEILEKEDDEQFSIDYWIHGL